MVDSKNKEHLFGDTSYHFRIALKRVEILNVAFPLLYNSHREKLAELFRKEYGIRNKEHQREIVDIINKKIPNLMGGDELEQLEHMDEFLPWEIPELKKYNLNLPRSFNPDPLHRHSFSMRTFIGPSPEFLREMILVFLIAHFEAFLKKLVSIAYSLESNSNRKRLPLHRIVKTDPEITKTNMLDEFGIDISKLIESETDWEMLKERFYRRNLLVHKGKIPDKKYKDHTKTSSDEPIRTDEQYLDKTIELFFDYPEKIREAFEKKYE